MATKTKTGRCPLKLEALEERLVPSTASASLHSVIDSSGKAAVFYIDPRTHAFCETDALHGTRQLSGPNSVQKFSAGLDAQGRADAYVLSGNGSVFQWSEGRGWVDLIDHTTITEFSAVKGGRMYAETNEGYLMAYNGVGGSGLLAGWSVLGGAGTTQHIDAVTDGYGKDWVYAIRGGGTFEQLDVQLNSWDRLSGVNSIKAGFSAGVGVHGNPDVYAVGAADGAFWKFDSYSNPAWIRLANAGVVSQFSATTDGQCWTIGTDGTLDKFNANNARMDVYGGYFTQISAAAGNDVFLLNWDNTGWERKAEGAWNRTF